MTEAQTALARRAVACPKWRWLPGMLVRCGDWLPVRMVSVDAARAALLSENAIPDLTDPGTLGCLLALVREAWGDSCACVLPIDYGPGGVLWVCRLTASGHSLRDRYWTTEAEALVAALESAP